MLALTSGRTSTKASSVVGRTAMEVGGTESLVGEARGTLALGPPAVAIAPLLADPRLVHEPDLDILSRLPGPRRVDLRSEVFLTDLRRPFAQ